MSNTTQTTTDGRSFERPGRRERTKQPTPKTLGQVVYEAYRQRAGGKPWHELPAADAEDWEVAASAVTAVMITTQNTPMNGGKSGPL